MAEVFPASPEFGDQEALHKAFVIFRSTLRTEPPRLPFAVVKEPPVHIAPWCIVADLADPVDGELKGGLGIAKDAAAKLQTSAHGADVGGGQPLLHVADCIEQRPQLVNRAPRRTGVKEQLL